MGTVPAGQVRSDELPECRLAPLDCRHLDEVVAVAATGFAVPWSRQDFAYFLAHELRVCLGLFGGDGRLDAYFLGLLAQGDLDVVSIATRPEARRRGLGTRLLGAACAAAGVERTFLEVATDNEPAVRLYRKLGFEAVGRRRGYYEGRRDALVMSRAGGPLSVSSS